MAKKFSIKKLAAGVLALLMVVTALPVNGITSSVSKAADDTVKVYRSYNPNSGEHFFTVDKAEHDGVVKDGRTDEGARFVLPVTSDTAIYRAYNPNTGEHLLVPKEEAEWLATQGWNNEGAKMYGDDNKSVGVYRVYNPNATDAGTHLYTGSKEEADYLVGLGWKYDNEGQPVLYAIELVEEEKEMTAEQTGAKEITLKFPSAVTGNETYIVKRGNVEQSVSLASPSEDKKTVVLTLDAAIKAGDYTVKSSDSKLSVAEFTGEEAEIADIIFGDELVATDNTLGSARVMVYAVDQFGDPIKSGLSESSFTLAGAKNPAYVNANTEKTAGVLTVSALNSAFALGNEVTITVVYNNNKAVKTVTLEVAASSVVDEFEVGELTLDLQTAETKTANAKLSGKRITADRIKIGTAYYLPVTAKDQYGNPLTKDMLNSMINKTLFISPDYSASATGIAGTAGTGTSTFTSLEDGTIAMFIKGDGVNGGDGIISVLSTGGFTDQITVPVEANEKIDVINVDIDDLQLETSSNVKIEAINQYGETVDLYELWAADSTSVSGAGTTLTIKDGFGESKITLTNGTWSVTGDKEKKKLSVTVKVNQAGVSVLTVQTATNNVWTEQLNVAKAATVEGIKGLSSKVSTTIVPGASINLADNVVFINTDGETVDKSTGVDSDLNGVTYPTLARYVSESVVCGAVADGSNLLTAANAASGTCYYTITKVSDTSYLTLSDSSYSELAAASVTEEKTEKWRITLYYPKSATEYDSTTKDITFTITPATSLTYSIGQVNAYPLNDTAASKNKYLYVEAKDASGNQVVLTGGNTSIIDSIVAENGDKYIGTITASSAYSGVFNATKTKEYITLPSKDLGSATEKTSGTEKIAVYIKGVSEPVTFDVPWSNIASDPQAVVAFKYDKTSLVTAYTLDTIDLTGYDCPKVDKDGKSVIPNTADMTKTENYMPGSDTKCFVIKGLESGGTSATTTVGDTEKAGYVFAVIDQYGEATALKVAYNGVTATDGSDGNKKFTANKTVLRISSATKALSRTYTLTMDAGTDTAMNVVADGTADSDLSSEVTVATVTKASNTVSGTSAAEISVEIVDYHSDNTTVGGSEDKAKFTPSVSGNNIQLSTTLTTGTTGAYVIISVSDGKTTKYVKVTLGGSAWNSSANASASVVTYP